MEHWEHEFAALGQELIAYLGENKSRGPAITRDLKERFEQIKYGTGHKHTEGIHTPLMDGTSFNNKDGYHMGTQQTSQQTSSQSPSVVFLKTPEGDDVGIDAASLDEIIAKAVARRGAPVVVAAPAKQELLSQTEVLSLERNAEATRRSTYGFKLQGTRIVWEWVELAGKAVLIGMVVVGTIWVLNKIWRGTQDGMMPEGAVGH
jgi:hypothetical protein